MTKSLEEIRRKLQALNQTKSNKTSKIKDKSIYPHWNITEGSTAIVRFLPDGNDDNTFFWVEKQMFRFPFPGVKGGDEQKEVIVQAPCIEMWEPKYSCPVLAELRPLWKTNDEELEKTASKYWVKRSYFMQGFVVKDPLNEEESPENPIRKFILTPQLFKIIHASIFDPEMTSNPVDFVNGLNFNISKTNSGGHASYTTSRWARNETSLSDEMLQAIETYGLVDLSTYLPQKPDAEHLAAIFEMFQASLAGDLYDPDKWAKYYKPYGLDSASDADASSNDDADAPVAKPVSKPVSKPSVTKPVQKAPVKMAAPVDESDDGDDDSDDMEEVAAIPVKESAKTSTANKTPKEIIEMLRNRSK